MYPKIEISKLRTQIYKNLIKNNKLKLFKQILLKTDLEKFLNPSEYNTLLLYCISKKRYNFVKYLIKIKVNVNRVENFTGYEEIFPLLEAVKSNNMKIVKLLLKNGANIKKKDLCGKPILFYAKSIKMVKLLSQYDNNLNLCYKVDTDLTASFDCYMPRNFYYESFKYRSLKFCKQLLDIGTIPYRNEDCADDFFYGDEDPPYDFFYKSLERNSPKKLKLFNFFRKCVINPYYLI